MTSPVASPAAPARSKLSLYLDLIRWNRPAGWLVLVWPTLAALWVAARGFRAGICCSSLCWARC
jgi:4-hydroxybenzoate polyprenyltransferase